MRPRSPQTGMELQGERGPPAWGVLPWNRQDPVSPGTKRNAMSTWFPLNPEIFFFFIFSWCGVVFLFCFGF